MILQENGTSEVKRTTPAGLRRKIKRVREQRCRRKLEKRTSAWSTGLEITDGATGLVPAAGVPLLRLFAEESGVRGRVSTALLVPGFHPGHDRGQVLVDVAIGLGARVRHGGGAPVVQYGFDKLGLTEILAVTTKTNVRSQAVMRRIGMTTDPAKDFDDPEVDDGPLRRCVLYRKRADPQRPRQT
ncbi:GNAT family N-acetyltransferase [Microbispora sp. CA-102843]|uniref:GNAT family N-acetyltransferase n=1 Tax=Microbispora sp. CA-102843 TaxID=3239952 RepID=UPI003D93BC0A